MGKNDIQKLPASIRKYCREACIDIDEVSLKLYIESGNFPKHLYVVDNDSLLAKIKIPTSLPHDVEIVSGSLTPQQRNDALKVLTKHTVGMVGWRVAYIFSQCGNIIDDF